jgi:hypothetical protein
MDTSQIILPSGIRTGTISPIFNSNPFGSLRRKSNIAASFDFTISSIAVGSVTLGWTANVGSSTEIWAAFNGGDWSLVGTTNRPATGYTHTVDLFLYNTLEYRIRTKNGNTFSNFSLIKKVTIGANTMTNGGYAGATDWVDSNSDGLADNFQESGAAAATVITGSTNGFADGYVQQVASATTGYFFINIGLAASTTYITKYKWRCAATGSGVQFGYGTNCAVNLDGFVYQKNSGNAVYRSYIFTTGLTSLQCIIWQLYNTTFYVDEWETHKITTTTV